MGKVLDEITDKEAQLIANAKVFFVATASTNPNHHVNVSPKAPGNSCIVLDPHTVAYADLTGSGAETAAHILQDDGGGRMTLMFCNLEQGPPCILRLFGRAELILPPTTGRVNSSSSRHAHLLSKFPASVTSSFGFRAIYKLHVHRISTSCGYSLPQMDFIKYRQTLEEYTSAIGQQGVEEYRMEKNAFSIDGLPSLGLLDQHGRLRLDIEPVPHDGYIYGKQVGKGEEGHNNSGHETSATADHASVAAERAKCAMELARQIRSTKQQQKQGHNTILPWISQVALLVAAFGAGMAAAHY